MEPEPALSAGGSPCPHCLEPVTVGARVCRWCDRQLQEAEPCPDCLEPVDRRARRCRWCACDLAEARARAGRPARREEPVFLQIRATNLGAFLAGGAGGLFTRLFLPPVITITNEAIIVKSWSLFGLRVFDQKISCRRIASVRYQEGILWGGISLETFGGTMDEIVENGLDKHDAKLAARKIELVVRD